MSAADGTSRFGDDRRRSAAVPRGRPHGDGLTPGFDVIGEAESGEDAVAVAAAQHPDLVLMDINLPGINGIEATRRIIAADPQTAVLLLSTYSRRTSPPTPATAARSPTSTKRTSAPRSCSTSGSSNTAA